MLNTIYQCEKCAAKWTIRLNKNSIYHALQSDNGITNIYFHIVYISNLNNILDATDSAKYMYI